MIGVTLLILAIFNGFAGYSLLDDLLSGTGLRIAYSIALSIPFVGHVAGLAPVRRRVPGRRHHRPAVRHPHPAHPRADRRAARRCTSAILWRQKHTQFRGPGPHRGQRRRRRGSGRATRASPSACFFLAAAVLCRARRPGPDQPDLALRPVPPGRGHAPPPSPTGTWAGSRARCGSCPPWELHAVRLHGRRTRSSPASLLPGLTFAVLYLWPFIEARLTGDHGRPPPARPAPRPAVAHRARRRGVHLLHGAVRRWGQRRAWPPAPECRSTR